MAYASSGQGNSPEFRRDWLAEFPEETAVDLPADGDEPIDSAVDDFTAKTSPGGDIFTWRPEPAAPAWPAEPRYEGQEPRPFVPAAPAARLVILAIVGVALAAGIVFLTTWLIPTTAPPPPVRTAPTKVVSSEPAVVPPPAAPPATPGAPAAASPDPRTAKAEPAPVPLADAPLTGRASSSSPVRRASFEARLPAPGPLMILPAAEAPPKSAVEGVDRAAEVAAIESVLAQFRRAYGALDVGKVAEVWPNVDRAWLARTFDPVAFQSLEFDDCSFDIQRRDGRATCRGRVRLVSKASERTQLESRQWRFALVKGDAGWVIHAADSSTRRD